MKKVGNPRRELLEREVGAGDVLIVVEQPGVGEPEEMLRTRLGRVGGVEPTEPEGRQLPP